MNSLVISIGIGIILVVSVFFILGLDKVIIKPLIIKDYAISNIDKLQNQQNIYWAYSNLEQLKNKKMV